jgi:nucleotide-binding universal stress UspA family protein
VVVGYDGSETSRAAVAWAAQRAGRSGKVYVVHSVGGPVNGAGSEHEHRGKALLDALLLEGDALVDVDYELLLVDGGAAHGIAGAAREHDADEIAVGSHGHGRLRAVLGSVSHELLHVADRPVTVIPARAAREREEAAP